MATALRRAGWKKLLFRGGIAAVLVFALIQAVPYGRKHSNPPVTLEPSWNTSATRAQAARSCFDCHSNLTKWRWYTNVAPASWLVQRDVDGGRSELNFSEWDQPQDTSIGDIVEAVRSGSMPPSYYTLIHGNASLSSAEKSAFVKGLEATFAASPPRGGG